MVDKPTPPTVPPMVDKPTPATVDKPTPATVDKPTPVDNPIHVYKAPVHKPTPCRKSSVDSFTGSSTHAFQSFTSSPYPTPAPVYLGREATPLHTPTPTPVHTTQEFMPEFTHLHAGRELSPSYAHYATSSPPENVDLYHFWPVTMGGGAFPRSQTPSDTSEFHLEVKYAVLFCFH